MKELTISILLALLAKVLAGLMTFLAILGTKLVREGELGSITRFGRAIRGKNGKIKVIKPGFVFLVTPINAIRKTHIRMQTLRVTGLNASLKNGLSYHYDVAIAYHVSDEPDHLEKYLYQVDEPAEAIELKLCGEIREILSTTEKAEHVNLEEINTNLQTKLENYLLEKIGVVLDSCGLTSFTESKTAQQVSVTKSKIDLAKDFYKDKIPMQVMAACLGATPMIPLESSDEITTPV